MGSNTTGNWFLLAFLKVKLGHSRSLYFYFRLSQTIDRETDKIAEARNLMSEAKVCQLRHYNPPLPLHILLPLLLPLPLPLPSFLSLLTFRHKIAEFLD